MLVKVFENDYRSWLDAHINAVEKHRLTPQTYGLSHQAEVVSIDTPRKMVNVDPDVVPATEVYQVKMNSWTFNPKAYHYDKPTTDIFTQIELDTLTRNTP